MPVYVFNWHCNLLNKCDSLNIPKLYWPNYIFGLGAQHTCSTVGVKIYWGNFLIIKINGKWISIWCYLPTSVVYYSSKTKFLFVFIFPSHIPNTIHENCVVFLPSFCFWYRLFLCCVFPIIVVTHYLNGWNCVQMNICAFNCKKILWFLYSLWNANVLSYSTAFMWNMSVTVKNCFHFWKHLLTLIFFVQNYLLRNLDS